MRKCGVLAVCLLALVACSEQNKKSVFLSGSITYKGQPVNGGSLKLFSASAAGEPYTIPIDQEGKFRIADVPEGEYKAVVQPSAGMTPNIPKGLDPGKMAEAKEKSELMKQPPTIPIPDKYKDRLKSTLTITVKKGEPDIKLELTDN
jgi:hypothetical protein